MNLLRNASLQRKQMLVIIFTSCVALLLAGAAFVIYEIITFRTGLREHLATLAAVIGDNATGALEFNDTKVAAELLYNFDLVQAVDVYPGDGR